MANEQQARVSERIAAVGALLLRLESAWIERLPHLPARSPHGPGNDVLEPAEGGAPVARSIAEPEAVGLLDRIAAPGANDPTSLCSDRACPSR
jgi:hypothetical protein